MLRYRPAADPQKMRLLLLALLAAVVALVLLPGWSRQAAFTGAPGLSLRPLQASPRLRLRADKDGGKVVDADVIDGDDESSEEESEEEFEDDDEDLSDGDEGYPEEAYADYKFNEDPPESWFGRRLVDRHKVNMLVFDQNAKPKSFFPHDLAPGDTIRAFYLEPAQPTADTRFNVFQQAPLKDTKETYFEGIILSFQGDYLKRTMTVRSIVGKDIEAMGFEITMPIHSPLLTKIEVLRRGYIGRNKNAYFVRGMIGKKNVIPLDKERTEMDLLYKSLRQDEREDEIPESSYPTNEDERYPIPRWWEDTEDWDESEYDPDMFDRRSQYEKEILGQITKLPRPRIRKVRTEAQKSGKE